MYPFTFLTCKMGTITATSSQGCVGVKKGNVYKGTSIVTLTKTNNSLPPFGALWEVGWDLHHHGYSTALDLLRVLDEAEVDE